MIPLASNGGGAKQGAGNKLPLFAGDSEALLNLQLGSFFFSFFFSCRQPPQQWCLLYPAALNKCHLDIADFCPDFNFLMGQKRLMLKPPSIWFMHLYPLGILWLSTRSTAPLKHLYPVGSASFLPFFASCQPEEGMCTQTNGNMLWFDLLAVYKTSCQKWVQKD